MGDDIRWDVCQMDRSYLVHKVDEATASGTVLSALIENDAQELKRSISPIES